MPDHVHMLYCPREDDEGNRYTKTEIVGAIKSASAHSVNRLLKRKGPVWRSESFDHVLRKEENVETKALYVADNPVRKGLCQDADEYPYLRHAWVDGAETAESPSDFGSAPVVGPAPSPVIDSNAGDKTTAGGGGRTSGGPANGPAMGQLNPDAGDLDVTAGWGHGGKGRYEARKPSKDEAHPVFGDTTYDVFLNDVAFWANVPGRVWDYTLAGNEEVAELP